MERESDRLHCEKNMRIRGASTGRGGKSKSMKLQIASDPFAKANVPDGIMERCCAFCNTACVVDSEVLSKHFLADSTNRDFERPFYITRKRMSFCPPNV